MIIDLEDHLLVGVTHPFHSELQVHMGITEHGAVRVAEVMRTDAYGFPFFGWVSPALLFDKIQTALNGVEVRPPCGLK